jgi:hypothetical protein
VRLDWSALSRLEALLMPVHTPMPCLQLNEQKAQHSIAVSQMQQQLQVHNSRICSL